MKSGVGIICGGLVVGVCVVGGILFHRSQSGVAADATPLTVDETAAQAPEVTVTKTPTQAVAKVSTGGSRKKPAPKPANPTAARYVPKTFPVWAVIKTPDALVRAKTAKETGKIKAGTVLSVVGPRVSQKLNMYPCLRSSTSAPDSVIYVAAKDLDFHPGELPAEMDTVHKVAIQRACLLAAIYKIDHLAVTANPYRRLLAKVQTDKAALKRKMPALITRRDAATAEARQDANHDLQALRDQLSALERKEKTLRDSMTEWAAAKRKETIKDEERLKMIDDLIVVNEKLEAEERETEVTSL